jgi:predicted ribosome quality control (RQC) complex YloA/Tae2 family protein
MEDLLHKFNINGFEVFVGKNNKQNDYIISKLSKDEDYWFHTRLCAGSHVLLKVQDNEPDEKTIFECCKIAREYSSAGQPSKVGVIYTKRKFIKKPPKAPLGYVIYKNEKEVLV